MKETAQQPPQEIDWNDTLLHGLVDDLEKEVRAEMNAASEMPEASIAGRDPENPAEVATKRNGQDLDISRTLEDAGSSNAMERIASMGAVARTQKGFHQSQDRKVEDIMRAHREYHHDC